MKQYLFFNLRQLGMLYHKQHRYSIMYKAGCSNVLDGVSIKLPKDKADKQNQYLVCNKISIVKRKDKNTLVVITSEDHNKGLRSIFGRENDFFGQFFHVSAARFNFGQKKGKDLALNG